MGNLRKSGAGLNSSVSIFAKALTNLILPKHTKYEFTMERNQIASLIAGIILTAISLVLLSQGVLSMSDVSGWLTPLLLGAILILFGYATKDKIKEFFQGKPEPSKVEIVNLPKTNPILTLSPLPHHKGYMLPPRLETFNTASGEHKFGILGDSSDEVTQLSSSQAICSISMSPNAPAKELIAKFGVIRVHCISGEALNCRVEVKVQLLEQLGRVYRDVPRNVGFGNWFSMANKSSIFDPLNPNKFEIIVANKGVGLNRYLKNTTVNLHYNEERDFLLFYMIKDIPNVWVCTDVESAQVGMTVESLPCRFEVELLVTADNYSQTSFKFRVTAKWDDYLIQQM
jgi:hypothetical protein